MRPHGQTEHFIGHGLTRSSEGLGAVLCDVLPAGTGRWNSLVAAGGTAVLAPLVVLLMLGLIFAAARALSKLGAAERRTADIWLCGYAKEADVHRYGAHNLYGEVKKYFHWVGGMPRQDNSQLPANRKLVTDNE